VYELWFKQILHELDSIIAAFNKPVVDDAVRRPPPTDPTGALLSHLPPPPHPPPPLASTPRPQEMGRVVERLGRVREIQHVLVAQIDVLETMSPL
jgi:tryptophan 2,3-dioxygenase